MKQLETLEKNDMNKSQVEKQIKETRNSLSALKMEVKKGKKTPAEKQLQQLEKHYFKRDSKLTYKKEIVYNGTNYKDNEIIFTKNNSDDIEITVKYREILEDENLIGIITRDPLTEYHIRYDSDTREFKVNYGNGREDLDDTDATDALKAIDARATAMQNELDRIEKEKEKKKKEKEGGVFEFHPERIFGF